MPDNNALPGPTALMTLNTLLSAFTTASVTEAKMAEAMVKMAADIPKHPSHCQRELRRLATVLRESSGAMALTLTEAPLTPFGDIPLPFEGMDLPFADVTLPLEENRGRK